MCFGYTELVNLAAIYHVLRTLISPFLLSVIYLISENPLCLFIQKILIVIGKLCHEVMSHRLKCMHLKFPSVLTYSCASYSQTARIRTRIGQRPRKWRSILRKEKKRKGNGQEFNLVESCIANLK